MFGVFRYFLGAAEITDFKDVTGWVDQEVLWLDVSVHDIVPVDVVQSSQELVGVQLGKHRMHLL